MVQVYTVEVPISPDLYVIDQQEKQKKYRGTYGTNELNKSELLKQNTCFARDKTTVQYKTKIRKFNLY